MYLFYILAAIIIIIGLLIHYSTPIRLWLVSISINSIQKSFDKYFVMKRAEEEILNLRKDLPSESLEALRSLRQCRYSYLDNIEVECVELQETLHKHESTMKFEPSFLWPQKYLDKFSKQKELLRSIYQNVRSEQVIKITEPNL